MILGIGIDVIEINRIKGALSKTGFKERVFTAAERDYCDSRGVQSAASYAARFAGKEALLKALGTGLTGGTWHDVEILSGSDGSPQAKLTGYFQIIAREKGVSRIYISLTHAREYAAAQVVLWGDKQ